MKRASDTPLPPRDIKRIRLDVDEAEHVKEEAEKKYYALKRELDEHPETRAENARASQTQIRKQLPDYLYNELVLKNNKDYGYLTSFFAWETLDVMDDGPYAFFEMSMHFSRRSKILTMGIESGKFDPFDEEYKIPKYQEDVEKVWKQSLELNEGDVAHALAGIIACAAIKHGDVNAGSDILTEMFGGKEEEESSTDIYS